MSRRRRWRLVRRRALIGAGLTVALLAPCAVWAGMRGRSVQTHLVAAARLAQTLRQQVAAGEPAAAAATLTRLRAETDLAQDSAADPLWRAGTALPGVGDDIAAVNTVVAVLVELAAEGLPALARAAEGVNLTDLAPRAGVLPVGVIGEAAPTLDAAERSFARASTRVAAIPLDGLTAPVAAAVVKLRAELAAAASQTATVARAGRLIPAMLGADGPRVYLLMFQNLAEVRATGGMPGAFAVVRADRGRVRVIDQGSAAGLRPFPSPVLALDPARRALYSDRLGAFPADVNLTPDFPTAARLFAEMYRRRSGRTVDGVLATDPVALSYLLPALGPVPVAGGPTLTAGDVVRTLLSRVYLTIGSTQEQDRYFAAATRAVFQALTQRRPQPRALVDGLARATRERRLLVWSARPAEQRELATTDLAGQLPVVDGPRPLLGLYLNDGSGAKLGYYLRPAATVTAGRCWADGRRELTVRVQLSSVAPRSGLPRAVTGLALAGDPTTARTLLVLVAPARGGVVSATVDGRPTPLGAGRESGRPAAVLTLDVPAGGARVAQIAVVSGPGATGAPRLWTTPMATPWKVLHRSAESCTPAT
ncbi:DUF4012 domain-containing protein [Pilimelia columellifera]|uniref:DUF4012 domain-containing protein n=1 Tax=Pilimelia columellifera subsp. columellifera TaxID=706583 RepID=A0ABP6B1W6_9ACTN